MVMSRNAALRAEIIRRDRGRCWYCGNPAAHPEIEHLIPSSAWRNSRDPGEAGGSGDYLWNLALSHAACNRLGGNLRFTEKLLLRDRLHMGRPIPARDPHTLHPYPGGNAATRRRNARYLKIERSKGRRQLPGHTLLELSSRLPCLVCGVVRGRRAVSGECLSCGVWARLILDAGRGSMLTYL